LLSILIYNKLMDKENQTFMAISIGKILLLK
jgi:hypothetical protein